MTEVCGFASNANMNRHSPIWHPFTQHALAPAPRFIERAKGALLYAQDGRGIVDAISSWWVITHGHCHPDIVAAVQKQAETLDQVIFAGFTHAPAEELAASLISLSDGAFQHVFYSDSGSTAVEVALKMAIGYWEHTGRPRQKIVAFEGGYHGDTFGTMSAGGRSVYNNIYEPFLFEVEHLPVPVAGQEVKTLTLLEDFLKAHKDNVAAFVFEPLVLGAGGMIFYSADILRKMAEMCRAHDVLLIADEVMTGFGRTGSVFACDQAGFSPDIICLSKGLTGGFLPLGATLCTHDVFLAFYHKDKARMFFHSSSFTGNPMACAAANASLKIWRDEPVMERIAHLASAHGQAVKRFERRSDIENLRQQGTILAMDIKTEGRRGYLSDIQPLLYDSFLCQDVLLRPLGNTVYILPPYCITQEELDRTYDAIDFALDRLGDDGQ